KFKFITEDVKGKNCLTNFHGMDLTRDKMCSMVKKWQTMIVAHVDVKTTDGYLLHLFGFIKKCNNQIGKTSYAQHQQVRQIYKKMVEIMTREVKTNDLKEVVNKLIPDSIGKRHRKDLPIYSLHNLFVQNIKMFKKPKSELGKLMELHCEGGGSGKPLGDETGTKVSEIADEHRKYQEGQEAAIMDSSKAAKPGLDWLGVVKAQLRLSVQFPSSRWLSYTTSQVPPVVQDSVARRRRRRQDLRARKAETGRAGEAGSRQLNAAARDPGRPAAAGHMTGPEAAPGMALREGGEAGARAGVWRRERVSQGGMERACSGLVSVPG
ncbi:LOW QUALITY PROTEIN: 40S ribosomal protein S3a-like, partial [Vombatus ursinus]|uniref:LOW QUALITY PROTEIN: 40S ribosomal protein S3a-like n=1 Tax=Vombatus ursinus TaxID=29139 RepID=UPI000FFD0CE9